MDYKIRKATKEDIDILAKYQSKIFNKDFKSEYDYIKYEILDNPVSIVLVAYIDNQIIGYLDYWITFDSATISTLGVIDEYKRMGIATTLLNEMFKDLIKNDVFYITLEVRKSNEAAISLYQKFGFVIATTKEKYYSDGEDAYYMVGETTYVKNNFSY